MNYFGKTKVRYRYFVHPVFDESANYYRPSIVDDETLVLASDDSSYQISDIFLLKGLNANSSPALAEALSMRMQVHESNGIKDVKDADIKESMRPRYTQDKTEVEAFTNIVLGGFVHDMDTLDADKEIKGDVTSGGDVVTSSDNVITT